MPYDSKNYVDSVCTYCGCLADSIDHVVPQTVLARAGDAGIDLSAVFRMRRWTVPACKECNRGLGSQVFATLAERRAAAHAYIRRKHAKELATPDWTEAELAELGPDAQAEIRGWIARRDVVRKRLAWRGARIVEDIRPLYDIALKTEKKTG